MRPGEDLLALYVAGALDPAEVERVQAWLERDAELRARVEALEQAPLDLPPRSPWRVPPPGVGLHLAAAAPAALDGRGLRPGDTVQLLLPVPADPAGLLVLVLRREDESWAVLAPRSPDQVRTLDRFAVDDAGRARVALPVSGPPGLQRLAVVLVPASTPIDWAQPPARRWAPVLAQLARRRAVVGSVEVEVEPG